MAKNIHQLDNYQLPKGLCFIDLLDANGNTTGEIDLGNIVSSSVTGESTNLTHFNSRSGLNEQDRDIVTSVGRSMSITLDSINMRNLSLFLFGDLSVINQSATPVVDEAITVQTGRTYQLGQTATAFMGVRNVTSVVIQDDTDTTTYVLDTDYTLDAANGRIYIMTAAEGGSIADDDVLHVDYTPAAETRNQFDAGSTVPDVAMRIVQDNADGTNTVHYIPKASMRPSGELNQINTEDAFATMPFSVGIQKKTATTPAVIIQDAA